MIIDKRGQRVPFILNSTQRKILQRIRDSIRAGRAPRKAILKARQVGVSTFIEALMTWDAVVRSDRSALVIAHVLKSSKSLFRMSRNFHRFLGGQFKQKTRIHNVSEVEYDTGSRLQVEVQGEARAYTAQMLHLSEFAFYLRAKDTLVAVMQSVPNTPDSLVAIESTANGMGGIGEVFYRLCMRAAGLAADDDVPEDEKGWDLIFIPWFDHEEYEMEVRGNFYLTDIEKQLMRDHPEITREKLKWRRWCISTNLDGDDELFAQEYPGTVREAFLLSGRPAFDVEKVTAYTEELAKLKLEGKLPPTCEFDTEQPGVSAPNIIVRERGRLRIFFEPEERHTYVVGADPSEGDPGSDPSPLAVLCQQTMNLAAVWYGRTPPDVLALHAIDMAKHYNQALIIGEANNHGILFNETVLQIGYPNLYYRETSVDSVAQQVTDKPGYLAGTRTRQNLFNTLRKYVRMRMGKLYSPEIIQQIQTAVYEEDKVQAGVGSDKDLLVAFGLTLMAHRGSMQRPLVALPDRVIRSVAAHAAGLKERDPGAADSYVLVATGMTQDEVSARMDAILAREVHQRKRGTGGMR